jgi:hypothetical protein
MQRFHIRTQFNRHASANVAALGQATDLLAVQIQPYDLPVIGSGRVIKEGNPLQRLLPCGEKQYPSNRRAIDL